MNYLRKNTVFGFGNMIFAKIAIMGILSAMLFATAVPAHAAPAPIANFTVTVNGVASDRATIAVGQTHTKSWDDNGTGVSWSSNYSVDNGTCAAAGTSGGWDANNASGTIENYTQQQFAGCTTTITYTVVNSAGISASKSIYLTVTDPQKLTQDKATTTSDAKTGQPFTVSWTSPSNTSSCKMQKTAGDGTLIAPWPSPTQILTGSITGDIVSLSGTANATPYKIGTHHWWIDCFGLYGTWHQDMYHIVLLNSPAPTPAPTPAPAATSGGGGGGIYQSASISINNGASQTATASVTLALATTPSYPEMLISNKQDGTDGTWQPLASTTAWTLTPGEGQKPVYVRFRNGTYVYGPTQSSILLTPSNALVVTSTPAKSAVGGQVLGASISCGVYLNSYIKYGESNDLGEVKKLQIFLNKEMGTNLSITGIYDLSTKKILEAFQLKYADEILRPWFKNKPAGAIKPTGYVYKMTQRKINLLMCPQLGLSMGANPETIKLAATLNHRDRITSDAGFASGASQLSSSTTPLTLTSGEGQKLIYATLSNETNVLGPAQASILITGYK